jgi:hypothetical protein
MFITYRELSTLGLARDWQPFVRRIPLDDWSVGVMECCQNLQIPVMLDTPFSILHYSIIRPILGSESPALKKEEF